MLRAEEEDTVAEGAMAVANEEEKGRREAGGEEKEREKRSGMNDADTKTDFLRCTRVHRQVLVLLARFPFNAEKT